MSYVYPFIRPEHLTPTIIERVLYPDLEHADYLSDCWFPGFYIALARAGFISIDFGVTNLGHLLLAALHDTYAVLDWNNLHLSRHVARMVRRRTLAEDDTYLIVANDTGRVIEGIQSSYGPECWVTDRYMNLMRELEGCSGDGFSIMSVQLWSGRRKKMIGGELGYTIGRTYTSLTGFLDRTDPESDNRGTLQLITLAMVLKNSGYAFWNLGQAFMEYKIKLGAKVTPRNEFLIRWKAARGLEPAIPLAKCVGKRYSCHDLSAGIYP